MLTFLPGAAAFAIAGVIAAAGPVIIHLLNRRRHRVVHWAAMDLLREALAHSRRAVHLRDLLLLALRTAALLLFGLALARPYFSASGSIATGGPLHAIVILDNSLSMGYQRVSGTLLDEAKSQAEQFVRSLPDRSLVTVIPLCAEAGEFSLDAYRTVDDAVAAIERVELVDRSGRIAHAAELAVQAAAQAPEIPNAARRVVLLGDHQAINWRGAGEQLQRLPELQLVDISAPDAENTWVADFRLQDGIANAESEARFVATVKHEGTARSAVPVSLAVSDTVVQTKVIDLEPGQTREVLFESYRFDNPPPAGETTFVPAAVSLPSDHLDADNHRALAVPLVASLPVVFVDQLGTDEDPTTLRYGDTRQLRGLLAPTAGRGESSGQLIEVKQAKVDEVSADLLQDARLVIVAGVESPATAVPDLRNYVTAGGQLVIVAGEDFDPLAWNETAWLDGNGILPAPLLAEVLGRAPEEAGEELSYFRLDFQSMSHEWLRPAEIAEEDLQAYYAAPIFFKAIVSDLDVPGSPAPDATKEQPKPLVLARFDNGAPYLVERRIGQGNVLFVASSLFAGANRPTWNTLPRMQAMFMFDRILRSMIERTLPRRTFDSVQQVSLPIRDSERRAQFVLTRPDGTDETLSVDALGEQDYGVSVRASARGLYTVAAHDLPSGGPSGGAKLWSTPIAINGPAEESELAPINQQHLDERLEGVHYRWISPGEAISLEGAQVRGQNLWWWLALSVLGCLLVEMTMLARPKPKEAA